MKRLFLTLTLSAAAVGTVALGAAQAAHTMPGMTMPASPRATLPTANAGAARSSTAVQALKLVQGWVAAAPPGAEELSVYLVLGNPGKAALTLVGVSSPVAGSAMLMTTGKDAAGRETMQMVTALKVPAAGQLKVLPGQAHLMLRNLKRQPQPGDRVPVTLRFSDGSARTVTLPVRRLP